MQNASLAIITDKHQGVLLVKRRDVPVWVLPGGGIDHGETPEHAIIRETYEETGMTCNIIDHVATYLPVNRMTSTTHLFTCNPVAGHLVPITSETVDAQFFPVDRLPSMLFPLHKNFIQDWQNASSFPITRAMTETSYPSLLRLAIFHPYFTLRYFWTRITH